MIPERYALVVDDDRAMGSLIARQLRRLGYDATEAESAVQANERLQSDSFQLIICDLLLGADSGLDVITRARRTNPLAVTVIMSGRSDAEATRDALARGVDEYLVKPFSAEQLGVAIAAGHRRRHEQARAALAAQGATDRRASAEQTLERLALAGRFRDEETAEHVERMSRTCALVGREMGMSPDACSALRMASAMHDIGKVGIPDAILLKPGRLSPAERQEMERHPEIGYAILSGSDDPVIDLAATIALSHHERVDGTGYPNRLTGDAIPIEGRIAAVADVFDALTHDRVYRPAFSLPEAMEMLQEGRGSHFDPDVLDAFERVVVEVGELRRLYPEPTPSAQEGPSVPAGEEPVRVLVVDDHDALARGMELILRREGFEIAGSARTVAEARGMLERRAVDVAVVDVGLAGESGVELVADARDAGARTLLYTGLASAETIEAARAAGASGIASKSGTPRELADAVRAVASGDEHFDSRFGTPGDADPAPALTPREGEVVALLAEGCTGEQIARSLYLSPTTVRTHIRNAMDRTGARTRAHLVAMALSDPRRFLRPHAGSHRRERSA